MGLQVLVRRVSKWVYRQESFVWRWRRARLSAMIRLVKPPRGARIIDLGGTEQFWRMMNQVTDHQFHVTLVNLPGSGTRVTDPGRFRLVEADACDLSGLFADRSFDLVFSNSTIEHVGDEIRRGKFAREVCRLVPAY